MPRLPFSSEDSQLITDLQNLSIKSPKLVKSTAAQVPGAEDITVNSWKMNEFNYYEVPSPFPTLARGLFTTEIPPEDGQVDERKYRIVVRGYDKFFNIDEVPWTKWPALEEQTAAPYVLSLKSNGCIIFISAITPTKIIVTSKHSVGNIGDETVSHALAGKAWLKKHLEKKEKKEKDLAAILWENNWTAIAELCDDSFEEHVLAYPPSKTGLHLHGINFNTKAFQTLPHSQVDAFALEWGFIQTPTISFDTIEEVKEFAKVTGETGQWNGEAVEGFVVRTHVIEPRAGSSGASHSPYSAGSSFFFKIKFDEPYMMYRDWREVTKTLLSALNKAQKMDASILPKSKMQRNETKAYVKWVIEDIKRNGEAFKDYSKGKGIIATRERFLRYLESEQGEGALKEEDVDGQRGSSVFGKTVIVPVAIPGCGKTVLSIALAYLFKFGHTQSDDVQAKKPGPVFIKNVVKLLNRHDVVIADKNNHLKQHRQALRDATSSFYPPVRLLALHWGLTKPPATIHRICSDRISARGPNHQTLRPDPAVKSHHEQVIWMFLNTSEELSASEVDASIEMEVEDDMENALRKAVDGVVEVLGLERPAEEKIQEALDVVRTYEPKVKQTKADEGKKARDAVRYFGLLPEVDLVEVLDTRFAEVVEEEADEETKQGKEFWEHIKKNNRFAKRPHVTITHKNSQREEGDLWERCKVLHGLEAPPLFEGKLGSLLWDDRVMAVTVEDLDIPLEEALEGLQISGGDGEDGTKTGMEGQKFIETLPEDVKGRLHVTVGTRSVDILPVEAKELVERWRKGEKVSSIRFSEVKVKGRVKGLMG